MYIYIVYLFILCLSICHSGTVGLCKFCSAADTPGSTEDVEMKPVEDIVVFFSFWIDRNDVMT